MSHFEGPAPEEPTPVATPAPFAVRPAEAPAAGREESLASFTPSTIELPSDLQQVESDPAKVRIAERQEPEDEAPRPRRVRPTLPFVDDEPLVQVETGESPAPADESTTTAFPR
jgi:hypothetical protein